MNPGREVFVLFTSQVGFRNQTQLPIIDAILSYPNVHFNYLNITQYAEQTPLEEWMRNGKLFRSKYLVSHTSDVLRFLSLWKYGGTYLDLDTVTMKPFGALRPNFAGAQVTICIRIFCFIFKYILFKGRRTGRCWCNQLGGQTWTRNSRLADWWYSSEFWWRRMGNFLLNFR